MPTVGLEMEMAIANRVTGASHAVGPYFRILRGIKAKRGDTVEAKWIGERQIGLISPGVISSLDNGFNNLESSIGPVAEGPANLCELHRQVCRELDDVCAALAEEGATILDMAEHPALLADVEGYHRIRAPKPIYDYWVEQRGWNHAVGIDAKAQNSPSTGVTWADAVKALNTLLILSPALIALHANSPIEAGMITKFKENRLTLWPRMFGGARFPGDWALHTLPAAPFHDLRGYFAWMFGPGRAMQCVPLHDRDDYKISGDLYQIDACPCLLDFLAAPRWDGRRIKGGRLGLVVPGMHQLDFLQFTSFLDARIRFRFNAEPFGVDEFLGAWRRGDALEELFADKSGPCYIEGRATGANFPDAELVEMPESKIAESVVMSPSALQTGLLRNLDEAVRLAQSIPYAAVPALRVAAIRDGLSGKAGDLSLERLCRQVVEVAGRGLATEEQWMLTYCETVLRSRMTGADRALRAYARGSGSPVERALAVARGRAIVWPLVSPGRRAVPPE
jgi:hypothetical protein